MKSFANLYTALDETNKTNEKVDALTRYFTDAAPEDAAWALYFLIGRRPRQAIPMPKLRAWAVEAAGIPDWLFGESYDAVGDFAETAALLLPENREQGSGNREQGSGNREAGTGDGEEAVSSANSSLTPDPRPLTPNPRPLTPDALPLHRWVEERLLPLREMNEAQQRAMMLQAWSELDSRERFVWHKLITGAFRVGVSQQLVTRALSMVSGVDAAVVAHRLMGAWEPSAAFYARLLSPDTHDADVSQPYPFCLAHPVDDPSAALGDAREWLAEWKWDGIRAQLIHRAGQVFLWSRGEELVTERYPELAELGALLPDGTVIDGEILPWKDGAVLPFALLQRRIGRKTLSKKLLSEIPVVLLTYDLLELDGQDVRNQPLEWRRARLEELAAQINDDRRPTTDEGRRTEDEGRPTDHGQPTTDNRPRTIDHRQPTTDNRPWTTDHEPRTTDNKPFRLSPIAEGDTWESLAQARERSREINAEGLMLKRRSSPYRVGRQRGEWWKWKIAPYTIDAVLIYAQRGSGKRASLYTDYTFAVWDNGQLVPFAKAYSGLTDAEIRQVDAFIRRNTVEKFGPVRTVKPELVFELAFEGIQRSNRHKSGIAVRFPRILRRRTDKTIEEADSLETIKGMLPGE